MTEEEAGICFRPDPRERDVIAEAERSLRRTDVQDVSPRGIFLVRFSFASFDEATITKFLTLFGLELPRCTETAPHHRLVLVFRK
jgi:hypothetical protein